MTSYARRQHARNIECLSGLHAAQTDNEAGATLTCGLEVVAFSSQPFWLSWPEAGKTCRHDPTTATSACTTPV